MNPKPDLEFGLRIQGAGGNSIPYSGCILCDIRAPFTGQDVIETGALIVPTTEYSLEVPVIIGTNAIDAFQNHCHQSDQKQIPDVWTKAFLSLHRSHVGIVKSTNKTDISIQPMQTVSVSGLVRKTDNVEAVVTEQTQGASNRIGVCPRVVSLEKKGNYQRVQVRLYNMSAKVVNIKPKTDLCELHEVKVLRSIDPVTQREETVNIKHQQVTKTEDYTDDDEFLKKLGIETSNITQDQQEKKVKFLTEMEAHLLQRINRPWKL